MDTDLGGENWVGRRGEDPVPALCSRVFRKRQGNFQSPRNVFLHGRGGAKNISCLYRFEAEIGERVSYMCNFLRVLFIVNDGVVYYDGDSNLIGV